MADKTEKPAAATRSAGVVRRVLQMVKQQPLAQWWNVAAIAVYMVLVLSGVTQSSLGIDVMREDPAAPSGHMIGGALSIRSDEFLTGSPRALGMLATRSGDDFNPLTAPDGFATGLPSGLVSSIVMFDSAVLNIGWMSDEILFASRWWLPFLLLALGAPAFFRALTGSRYIGMFAAVLCVASPSAAWWSFGPLPIIGFTVAGSVGLIKSAEFLSRRRAFAAFFWALISAILLARTPLHYQPWAIVVAVPILAMAVVSVIRKCGKPGWIAVAAIGIAALALCAGFVAENIAGVQTMMGTAYPGSRIATGAPQPLEEVFGATNLGKLEQLPVVGTNPCELSSSYSVLTAWVVILLASGTRMEGTQKLAVAVLSSATVFWFSWILVDYGEFGYRIPVVNLVPPPRAADVIGFLVIFLVCLVLPSFGGRKRWPVALSGITVCLIAANAGSLLRSHQLPELPVTVIWISSIILGLLVMLVTWRPRWWCGYVAGAIAAASLIYAVNPILFGLADLRSSSVAQEMLEDGREARLHGQLWVSDSLYVDSLFLATGVPSLSGRQLTGPDEPTWRRLVPSGTDPSVWNRGGSFVWFNWTNNQSVSLTNPTNDSILISGSPCAVASRFPALAVVVSSHKLEAPCLTSESSFTWSGNEHWRYAVR